MKLKAGLTAGLLAMGMLGLTGLANATLTTIGTATYDDGTGSKNYNLIYDDDAPMGAITWLDYTNADALWQEQMDWAAGLNGAGVLTYNLNGNVASWTGGDWRLPATVDGPFVLGTDGTTTYGYNITSSEMGHLYYVELGNLGGCDTSGNCPQPGWGLANAGDFVNLGPTWNWSGTESALYPVDAWTFDFFNGFQSYDDKLAVISDNTYFGVAVRTGKVSFETGGGDGQAPVPEPATMLLFGTGIAGLAGTRMRRKKK
jgi:hypothetical protein